MAKDDYVLSPIMINDNVVDLTVVPATDGNPASLEVRPVSTFYGITVNVQTVAADRPQTVTITSTAPNQIEIQGQIPEGSAPLLQTFRVEDPPPFARTLFIEALVRHGVTIDAPAVATNPVDRLPANNAYAVADRVALLTSLPFSEVIKLILKVSLNQGTRYARLPTRGSRRVSGPSARGYRRSATGTDRR